MNHKPNCDCPGCEGKAVAWYLEQVNRVKSAKVIRRLLRERARMYRVMADAIDNIPREAETQYDSDMRQLHASIEAHRLVAQERARAK